MSEELMTTSGKAYDAKDFYPAFSWDKVPVYMMFGSDTRLLEDSEITKIANESPFICIEKQHGKKAFDMDAFAGLIHETARFKAENPNIIVLGYHNAAYTYPFNKDMQCFDKLNISKYPELHEYLLCDTETNELLPHGPSFMYNVTNDKLRSFWVDKVVNYIEKSGADGYFIDQMHGNIGDIDKTNPIRSKVKECVADMLRQLRDKMPPNKILLANNGAHIPAVFDVADAFMYEHYSAKTYTKEKLLAEWATMEKIADAGKMVIIRYGAKPEPDHFLFQHNTRARKVRGQYVEQWAELSKQQCTYYLAAYLIGAQPFSYFQWGWAWNLETGPLEDYAEFHKPLGKPLGKYERTHPDKWEFTRSFEHADVWIDTDNREAKIEWKSIDDGSTAEVTRCLIASPSVCPIDSWKPSALPNVNLWLDASDRETITEEEDDGDEVGSHVSKWEDKSGNNYHALQPNKDDQPLVEEDVLNGITGITCSNCRFFYNDTFEDGDWRDVYIVGHWTGPDKFSVCNGLFTASNQDPSPERSIGIVGKRDTTELYPIHWWDDLYINGSTSDGGEGTLGKLSDPFIMSFSSNDKVSHLGYGLGCDRRVGANRRGWEGHIAEVVSFSSKLSKDDREKVEGYLAHKWFGEGEENTLPTGHTYKDSPPKSS